jgi:hypothetical protein
MVGIGTPVEIVPYTNRNPENLAGQGFACLFPVDVQAAAAKLKFARGDLMSNLSEIV